MSQSELPGLPIREIFEGTAEFTFPFWVAPWREGPTIAHVFDQFLGWSGYTDDFAANVFDLEAGAFVASARGGPLIVRIADDDQTGWLHVHVDYDSNQLLRSSLVTFKDTELAKWSTPTASPNWHRSRL